MFRKDFKLEMLAQDEESRKAELAEKQKALSGAKKRMEDLDRIIQHIYEDNVQMCIRDSPYPYHVSERKCHDRGRCPA